MESFRGRSGRASGSSIIETSNREDVCLIKEVMKLKEISGKVSKSLIRRIKNEDADIKN